MILQRTILTGFLFLAAAGAANGAAEHCFTRAEQRAKTAAHAVVPLSRAMRAVRKHGEVIHARLCEHGGHPVYLLTVLADDGKVAQASVDAVNGAVVGAHAQEQVGQEKQDKREEKKADKKQDTKQDLKQEPKQDAKQDPKQDVKKAK
ncbi:MAG TPA: hypothetical protein VKX28_18035 [Xanthobacteraceae bacterium]|nr:hypothetical protein [Xanthobacteraceae bacterium]